MAGGFLIEQTDKFQIPGNELADTEAKTVTAAKSDPPKTISYSSARSLNHRTLLDPLPANSQTAEVFGGFKWH